MQDHNFVIETRVILFMDVHNYSMAIPVLGRDQYGFLQEMYERLGDVVVDHQGEILKYMGDAILCVFLAGSEDKAVQCALELRKTFADMVRRRGLPSDTELETGIGSGEVGIGIFGHRSLQQKDVFGEEVHRVAKIGHHRGIAVTERVYNSIKASYETRRLPDFKVKWQQDPLKVWEVREAQDCGGEIQKQ